MKKHMEQALTEEMIRNLDPEHFSPEEKRYLQKMFFPQFAAPEWKVMIQRWWESQRRAEIDAMRWDYITGKRAWNGEGEVRYRVGIEDLLRTAKRRKPVEVVTSVAAFSDWIHSLYLPTKDRAKLAKGREGERAIARRIARYPRSDEWILEFDGSDPSEATSQPITELAIAGSSLFGKPDFVFRHRDTAEIVILEFKWSPSSVIPRDCWPDAKAKMWAYSKTDRWKGAPRMTLAAEVWGRAPLGVALRRTYRWDCEDKELAANATLLYDAYRRGVTELIGRGDR